MQTITHLSVLVHEQAKKYGNRSVFTFQSFGSKQWKQVSWNQFSLRVKQVSNALLNLNFKPQENIAVFAQNCIQYLYTDFGAYGIRAVSIPFYATSSETQIQYMINDAQVRVLFVGEQEQYDKALRVFTLCPSLERIIIFDESVRISANDPNSMYYSDFLKLGEGLPRQTEVENLYKQANMEDLCNILYTSGTTGDSKGVMLTYGQYNAALEANGACVPIRECDRSISFLPITHIFERGWCYLCLSVGAHVIINTNPKEIQQSMRETHPTCMSSVPRFWEKVYQAVKDKIDRSGAVKQKLFAYALSVGKKYNIDWKRLRISHLGNISKKTINGDVNYPISFIYIKSTEGASLLNPFYRKDYVAARAHGYKVGSYHFFSTLTPATLQARQFLKNSYVKSGDLPPVLDVEPTKAQIQKMGGVGVLLARMRIWLRMVEKETGKRPIIYVSQTFVNRYLSKATDIKQKYQVWIARYGEYKPDIKLVFWQLCPDGRVTGIRGHVDINVFNGYHDSFKQFISNLK